MADGMNEASTYCLCEGCLKGRMREIPQQGALRKGEYVGDVVHVDICGPFHITGYRGERYWITIVDGFSRLSLSKALNVRAGAWAVIKNAIHHLENHETQRRRCRYIHPGGAKEFKDGDFIRWAAERGMRFEPSPTEQHQSNGLAEAFNITIREKLLPAMIGGNVPKEYWPEVLETVNYLRNRSPHNALDFTPFQIVYN